MAFLCWRYAERSSEISLNAECAGEYEFVGWYDTDNNLYSDSMTISLEAGNDHCLFAVFADAPITPEPTPTILPTEAPTVEPTATPEPTETAPVTEAPTEEPTEAPTGEPTAAPTEEPTQPPVPSTGAVSLIGISAALLMTGAGAMLFRKR